MCAFMAFRLILNIFGSFSSVLSITKIDSDYINVAYTNTYQNTLNYLSNFVPNILKTYLSVSRYISKVLDNYPFHKNATAVHYMIKPQYHKSSSNEKKSKTFGYDRCFGISFYVF